MRLFLFIALCIPLLSLRPNARAQTPNDETQTTDAISASDEENVPEKVTLLGRGLKKHGSNESIALACLNDSCHEVRFVHFKEGSAEWVGSPIIMPTAPDQSVQKEAERLQLKKYLIDRKHISHSDRDQILDLIGAITIILGPQAVLAISAGSSIVPEAGILLAPAALYLALYFLIIKPSDTQIISNKVNRAYNATHDQKGWNWSERPYVLSRKKFTQLLTNVSSPLSVHFGEYDKKQIEHLDSKMRKMRENGVHFSGQD